MLRLAEMSGYPSVREVSKSMDEANLVPATEREGVPDMPGLDAVIPIAIVGYDCRLPGAADPAAYWRLLEQGKSALGELPPDLLDRDLYFAPEKGTLGKTYSTVGGIVPDRPVRAEELGLVGTPFERTDSAFLAICDVSARALRHAGLDPFHLPRRQAGVYLGSTGGTRHSTDWIFATLIGETAGYLRELSPPFAMVRAVSPGSARSPCGHRGGRGAAETWLAR